MRSVEPLEGRLGPPMIPLVVGRPQRLTLKPFEVLVFEAQPGVN